MAYRQYGLPHYYTQDAHGPSVLIDYSEEPRVYPDGHVCNAWCLPERGEHCSLGWCRHDIGAHPILALQSNLPASGRNRCVVWAEYATEARPADQTPGIKHLAWDVSPPTETAYRYWFTYPARIEAEAAS